MKELSTIDRPRNTANGSEQIKAQAGTQKRLTSSVMAVMTGAQWYDMSWVEVVEQHEIEKYGDSEENLLGMKAQKQLENDVPSLTIMFSDCDAGGGFSETQKVIIRRTLAELIKILTLTYSYCKILGDNPELRNSLKNRQQMREQFSFFIRPDLTAKPLLDEIAGMFYFMTDPMNVITIFNDGGSTQSLYHSCSSGTIYRSIYDASSDRRCGYQGGSCVSHIVLHEAVLHFSIRWHERVNALYQNIARRRCGWDNISQRIFQDVLNHYKDRPQFSDAS